MDKARQRPFGRSPKHERASAHEQTGAHDRALADIAQAIKLDPNNPDLHRLK